eukprot:m.61428 g.61428  ORF g.61428 m.61428 type:complete len:878 (-) comp11411_c0_seq1:44-2677(-)
METALPADWESIKENARPLKEGYKVKSLASLLDSPAKRDDLEEQRRQFESEVAACGGADPLDAWRRYISWAEKHAASGELPVDRKRLLERCTAQFRDYAQYKDDERYLKICLKYADCCGDPREVFLFLEQQKIGTQSILLYTAWAFVLENLGQFKEAERVFETGKVVLSEEGSERLAQRQQQFRERIKDAKKHNYDSDNEEEHARKRAALGEVRKTKRGRVASNRAPMQSKGGLMQSRPLMETKKSNGSIPIFHDPDGAAPTSAPKKFQVFSDLPTESITAKENTQEPTTWEGGIKTKAKKVAPTSFQIFQDEEKEEDQHERAPMPSWKDMDRKALGNYKPPTNVPRLKDYQRERGTTRKVDGGVLGFDPVPLFGNEEECCFEETRAKAWLLKKQKEVKEEEVETYTSPEETYTSPVKPEECPKPKEELDERCVPSPTINTKEAYAEVMAMFGSAKPDMNQTTATEPESTVMTHAYPSRLGENEFLSPILETSKDSSSALLDTTKEVAIVSWPLEKDVREQWMSEGRNLLQSPNCLVSQEPCPLLEEGMQIPMQGLEDKITVTKEVKKLEDRVVFQAVAGEREPAGDDEDSDDDEDMSSSTPFILKLRSPAFPWEFFVLHNLHTRLASSSVSSGALMSIPKAQSLHLYSNAHLYALDQVDDFSLQDVVNMHVKQDRAMDEAMVMFYTIELLRIVESLHSGNIVHCRISPETLILRNQTPPEDWDIMYSPNGSKGWAYKGLFLANFETSVDMKYIGNQVLSDCSGLMENMKEYQTWTYEVDYHGTLEVVHQLLHSEPLAVSRNPSTNRYAPEKSFKKFWQVSLWESLFDQLLNAQDKNKPSLSNIRHEFENYLTRNPYKAKSLKQSLVKQDLKLYDCR